MGPVRRRITMTLFLAGCVSAAGLSLGGCSMDMPTALSQKPAEVVQETKRIELNASEVDDQVLAGIAQDYLYSGDGPVDLTVTYNPASKTNTAMMASDNVARMAAALKRNKVPVVRTDILPVSGAETSLALFRFAGYRAQMPSGCTNFEDIDDKVHENFRAYQLGCSTESYIAQQVARPRDLLGRGDIQEETGARKHANNIEAYKWGANLLDDVEADTTSDN